MYKEVLQQEEKTRGNDHPSTLTTRNNLALSLLHL